MPIEQGPNAVRGGQVSVLSARAITRDGFEFDPREPIWELPSLVSNYRKYRFDVFPRLSAGFLHNLKIGMLFYVTRKSASYFKQHHERFSAFYREILADADPVVDQVRLGHILAYKGRLDKRTEWKLGVLRILLEDMERTGVGIASKDALDYLHDSVFSGNPVGTSIRTRDPNNGAFTDAELLQIQSALNDAYASGNVSLRDFAAAWLLLAYGVRPIQIAALKESDLLVSIDGGAKLYALRIPRAKQRGVKIRGEFKTRYCSKQVGQLLEALINANRALRKELQDGPVDEWPLFMSGSRGRLPDLEYHCTSQELGRAVSAVVSSLTGLRSNPKRFRITLGQRAADDGKDMHTLAELLDHSNTRNVVVYYEASPAIALRLDRHLAIEMAPLAQAFAGVIVDAQHRADHGNRIYDRSLANNAEDPLGDCGQMSFCGLSAPFACYTCRHFQPWHDGPHEDFLAALIADRDRMVEERYSPKIYAIRDRTILAVAEVIQLCTSDGER